MKRSQSIFLLLSGALATTIGPAGCSDNQDPPPPPATGRTVAADQLRADQDQDNNSYVPGTGYYHSLYHTYYPYPFNWYSPGHGYYYAGGWQATPFAGLVPDHSRPTASTIASVQQSVRSGSSGGGWFTGGHGGSFSGSSVGHSGISTGGFGSSAHAGSAGT